ncbi:hypothetical protein [Streptomyces sp. NPDC003832]
MTAADGVSATFKALLVGNANFTHDRLGLERLRGPLNDVEKLFDELSNPDTGLFDCQRPLTDATYLEMQRRIGDFFSSPASRSAR